MSDPFTKERPKKLASIPHSRALAERMESLKQEIEVIRWQDFDTAYGAPTSVPLDLSLLLFGDQKQALEASHRLWCGLCHQHAYMSSAAEPALPYLMLGLRESNDLIRIEILDILLGFVRCHDPRAEFTDRVFSEIARRRSEIEELKRSGNREVVDFAAGICAALDEIRAEPDAGGNSR
jgi:hypothetical protein